MSSKNAVVSIKKTYRVEQNYIHSLELRVLHIKQNYNEKLILTTGKERRQDKRNKIKLRLSDIQCISLQRKPTGTAMTANVEN